MTSLVQAIYKKGRWENPVEFDTWKIPGKFEFLKLKLTEKDHSDIPTDPRVLHGLFNFKHKYFYCK